MVGLTAAHELAERGYAVTVYERRALGGKARSMDAPELGAARRRDLWCHRLGLPNAFAPG